MAAFKIVTAEPIEMCAGTVIEYRLRLHGLQLPWLTRIGAWEPGRGSGRDLERIFDFRRDAVAALLGAT